MQTQRVERHTVGTNITGGARGGVDLHVSAAPLLAGTSSVLFRQQQQHLVAQNWGHVAVIILIVLGNLSAFMRRSNRG